MRKIVFTVSSLICTILCACGLVACHEKDPGPTPHKHAYSWTDNGDGTHDGHCAVGGCDKPFIDDEPHSFDANNKCEKCKAEKIVEKHSHEWSPSWNTSSTHHWHECSASGCPVAENSQKNGYAEHTAGAAATETTPQICTVCKYVLIEALGHTHTMTPVPAKDASCTEDGNVAYYTCVCGKYFSDVNGETEIELADTVIGKRGHDMRPHAAQAATCTEKGWNAYEACSRCDHTTYSEIAALGHKEDANTTVCSVCGITVGTKGLNYAYDPACEGYSVSGIGTATGNKIIIASKYNGKPVTSIADGAFSGCGDLTSITIPNGVTSIGDGAFSGCNNLTSIEIPNSLTSIGNDIFDSCGNLQYTAYENGLYLGNTANQHLILVKASDRSVTSFAIHENTKFIYQDALIDCGNLTSLTIPNGVTSIGNDAFSGCSRLTSIELPDSIASIGNDVFLACGSLQYTSYENGLYLGNANNKYLVLIKVNDRSVTAFTIAQSTKFIYQNAFAYCEGLTSITIPNGITSIGDSAFVNCKNIADITFAQNSKLTRIGEKAFGNCSGFTYITIPDSVTSIEDSAFLACTRMMFIEFDRNSELTRIGNNAFMSCEKLTGIDIPNSVTSIGEDAFYNSGITSVKFGENSKLTSIGKGAFYACSSLTSITIPSGVTSIGDTTFRECSRLKSITFDENSKLTSIGVSAFYNCDFLSSIEIPSGVTSIGGYAFRNCRKMTSITFGENTRLTSIGNSAFDHCDSLTSIIIPIGVTIVEDYAFYGCGNLTIYCEAQSQPNGWGGLWNYSNRPVVWDCKNAEKTSA